MTTVFVSAYTPSYAEEAAGLVASLDAFDLPHDVEEYEDQGSWEQNAAHKATYLLGKLADHSAAETIVWLDADARVVREPTWTFPSDHACLALRAQRWPNGKEEYLSGTLYLRPRNDTRLLLMRWMEWCRQSPGDWDQRVLKRLLLRHYWPTWNLPAEYCCIPDLMLWVTEPVIVHGQASRRLKNAGG